MTRFLLTILLLLPAAVQAQMRAAVRVGVDGADVDTAQKVSVMPESIYTNCVLWMPCSKTKGTNFYDYSSSRNDGRSTNANTAPVVANGYATFDGSDDYVTIGDVDILNQITISMWIYQTATYRSPIGKRSDTGDWAWQVMVTGTSNTAFYVNAPGTQFYGGTTPITQNVWHHIACTYNGAYLALYLDGVQDGTNWAASGTIANTADEVRLGFSYSATYIWGGRLDDVRLYNRALSAAEISSMYNSTLTGHP